LSADFSFSFPLVKFVLDHVLQAPRITLGAIFVHTFAPHNFETRRRVARRMSRIAFSALSFFFVIIVPLAGNDESNVSLTQTACSVRLLLTGHNVTALC
jgi:hypothetical protein